MQTVEELAGLKQRLGALEAELGALRSAVALFEQRLALTPTAEPTAVDEPPLVAELVAAPPAGEVAPAPEAGKMPALLPEPPVVPGRETPPLDRVEARVVEPPVEAVPPGPPRANPLRAWLEPLQLWPPAGEENAEVRLAAWWATRIGALLAVIGVVFLGIYVSRNAPPWVRLAEVMAVTGGVLGLGSWLERKLPTFGAVVFGAGLALGYFCAFAAYAVPPMKVIAHPLGALLAEVSVVAGIFAVAWRRNSPVVATMAVALGYVTAFLALRDERFGFGPWVVLLLGTAAVLLRLTRGWAAPSALAMPLTWLYLAAAAFDRGVGLELGAGAVWFWCALHLALFTARDWIAAWRGGALDTMDRALQVTNSSLAVGVGLLAAARAGGEARMVFFFGSGAAMLLLAQAWRLVRVAPLAPILVCKGSGLIALGVIDAFAGPARGLVLLAQAFVMLVSTRQSHQRWLRVATLLVAAVALGFYLEAMRAAGAVFWSGATLVEVAFLAGAVGFTALAQRWLAWREVATTAVSAALGLVAIATAARWQVHGWAPAIQVGLGALLAALAVVLRGAWPASIVGGMLLATAHAEMWLFPVPGHGRAALWWSEVAVLAGGIAAGLATLRLAAEKNREALRAVIAAVASATLVTVCFKGLAPAPALAAALLVPLGLVAAAARARGWPFAVLAAPLSGLAGVWFGVGNASPASPWLWVAAAAAWAVPLWFAISAARLETIGAVAWRRWGAGVHTWFAAAVTLFAAMRNLEGQPLVIGLALMALAMVAATWRPGLHAALEASWPVWLAAAFSGFALAFNNGDCAAMWFAAVGAWAVTLAVDRTRAFAAVRASLPSREFAGTTQAWIATGLTALAIVENLQGPARLLAFVVAAWGAFALVARPGLRAGLETSWAFWLATMLVTLDVARGATFWLVAVAGWVPAVVLARTTLPAAAATSLTPWRKFAGPIQVALATALTLLALGKNLTGPAHLLGLALAAVAMLVLAGPLAVRAALEASWVVWGVVLLRAAQLGASAPAWIAAALGWSAAIALARLGGFAALRASRPRWRAVADSVQIVLATLLAAMLAIDAPIATALFTLAALVLVAMATWRAAGVGAARPAAFGVAAMAWLWALRTLFDGVAAGWGAESLAVLAVAALASALPFFAERDLEPSVRARLRWPAAGAGLALAFALCVLQRGALAPYATVGCGLAAVATFLAGLYARSRPHRLCGLAGLALCIPRAFLVDLDSTLYRIAAFVALGLVLLWVGFSYHRFRHLIVEEEKKL